MEAGVGIERARYSAAQRMKYPRQSPNCPARVSANVRGVRHYPRMSPLRIHVKRAATVGFSYNSALGGPPRVSQPSDYYDINMFGASNAFFVQNRSDEGAEMSSAGMTHVANLPRAYHRRS